MMTRTQFFTSILIVGDIATFRKTLSGEVGFSY